ncbi:MAG: hypothetical protein ACYTG0_21315 [Planctomycetota bacterium]
MSYRRLPILALLVLAVGPGCREETAPSGSNNASGGLEDGGLEEAVKVGTYDTGDVESWPSYDFPMEIHIEVPEVPENVAAPWRPADADRQTEGAAENHEGATSHSQGDSLGSDLIDRQTAGRIESQVWYLPTRSPRQSICSRPRGWAGVS